MQMHEQETTVSAGRTDEYVQIWTSNIVHLRALRKDSRVKEVYGSEEYGQFEVSAEVYDPIKGFKRASRKMTEEQRAAASERLAKARAARGTHGQE